MFFFKYVIDNEKKIVVYLQGVSFSCVLQGLSFMSIDTKIQKKVFF